MSDVPVILKSSAEIQRLEGEAAPHWRIRRTTFDRFMRGEALR